MLSKELENQLNRSIERARKERHEFVSLEHILLALLDDPGIQRIVLACEGNVQKLKSDLERFLDEHCPRYSVLQADGTNTLIPTNNLEEQWRPEFTLACHRLLQRAVIQVQSAGRDLVECQHVLVALFEEK